MNQLNLLVPKLSADEQSEQRLLNIEAKLLKRNPNKAGAKQMFVMDFFEIARERLQLAGGSGAAGRKHIFKTHGRLFQGHSLASRRTYENRANIRKDLK